MNVQYVQPDELSWGDREEMFRLMSTHFDGVERDVFLADLEEKSISIMIRDGSGTLTGFSTLRFYTEKVGGREVEIVCSGDTVIDSAARHSSVLSRAWLEAVIHHEWNTPRPVYWLLICSSYRTYRFLPLYWLDYYPNPDTPTPLGVIHIMHELATRCWGECFDPARGIVKLPAPQVAVETVDRERRVTVSKHVRFFLEKNPGMCRGDELLCLVPISPDNLSRAGHRMLRTVGAAVGGS